MKYIKPTYLKYWLFGEEFRAQNINFVFNNVYNKICINNLPTFGKLYQIEIFKV